jgi:hypothetical protein
MAGLKSLDGLNNITAWGTSDFSHNTKTIVELIDNTALRDALALRWAKIETKKLSVVDNERLACVPPRWPMLDINKRNIRIGRCQVLVLYSYCTHTHSYCTHTVLILYSYCTHTVLILYSYCAHTILILYSYCTHTVLVLCSYSPTKTKQNKTKQTPCAPTVTARQLLLTDQKHCYRPVPG